MRFLRADGEGPELRLARGARVDQAADGAVLEIVVETGLVAGDADSDALAAAGNRLVGELGIGEQRARHGDEIAGARRDEPVGDLRQS